MKAFSGGLSEAIQPRLRRQYLSWTLSGYIARQYLFWFGCLWLGILSIILLATIVDLMDQLPSRAEVPLTGILELAFLRTPFLAQEVMPFAILFSAMIAFWRLTRSSELVVARAAGVSVWQFLAPVLASAVMIGVLTTTVLNPFASATLAKFESKEAAYRGEGGSMLEVSRSGLWLRQAQEADGSQSVLYARAVTTGDVSLQGVIVFRFSDQDQFSGRIDAARAELLPGEWQLYEAWVTRPGEQGEFVASMTLPTELTSDTIYESFAPPTTIAFWRLPEFISLLKSAGFAAQAHEMQFHRLLSNPLLFVAMILLAATFSMRGQRRGRVGTVIGLGVLTGFLIYFVSNFVFALGLSGRLPVVMAAWTPAVITAMLGIASLLHLEDG